MADPGSVSYLFSRRGVVIVPKAGGVDEDDVLAAVLDTGAEEVNDLGESFEVISDPGDLVAVRTALQDTAWTMSQPSGRSCRRSRSSSTRTTPGRCSASSRRSRIPTTCRTSTPTTTSPTTSWKRSAEP